MTKAGTYTLQIEYFPPGDPRIESVSLDFQYNSAASATPQTEQGIGTEGGTTEPTTTFQNLTEGFRIQVPDGWVADDYDVSDSKRQELIATSGMEFLSALCPQEQALPKIGGLYDCARALGDVVEIVAYPNLNTRPEFARLINQNQNITLNDLVALDIEESRKSIPNPDDASRLSIESQTETTVNVVDPITNQTMQTLPARVVAYGLPATFGDEVVVKYNLLVLADNGRTGYRIHGITEESIELDDVMPAFVRQAFDSFELLATNSSGVQQLTTAEGQQRSQQNNAATTAPSFSNSTAPTTPSTPFTPVL